MSTRVAHTPIRKLLLVEPEAGGHHFVPYLQFFVRALLAKGLQLRLLTTRSAAKHPAWQMLQSEFGESLPLSWMDELPTAGGGTAALLRGQWRYWSAVTRGYAELANDAQPDHVFLLSLDGLDRALAVRGSPFAHVPYSGLLVHMKLHWPELSIGPAGRFPSLQAWLFTRLLQQTTLHAVASIDELFVPYWATKHPKNAKKLRFVPDPGELKAVNKTAARVALELPDDVQVVLVYGGLSARKGIAELLKAILLSPRRMIALLAGVIDEDTQALLSTPEGRELVSSRRVHLMNAYLDSRQEQQVFSAADVVWLGYARDFHGQSAVLAQAASANRPVLAREGGMIGQTTMRYRLGLCVDPNDSAAVCAALERLETDEGLLLACSAGAAQFSPKRSAAAFGAAMLSCLPFDCTSN